jgi:hypothetical protein
LLGGKALALVAWVAGRQRINQFNHSQSNRFV